MASIFDQLRRKLEELPQQFQAAGTLVNQSLSDRLNQAQIQAPTRPLFRLQTPELKLPSITADRLPIGVNPSQVFTRQATDLVRDQGQKVGNYLGDTMDKYKGFASNISDFFQDFSKKATTPISQKTLNRYPGLQTLADPQEMALNFGPGAIAGVTKQALPKILKPLAQEAKNFSRFDEFVKAVQPKITYQMGQTMEQTATGLKSIFDRFGNVPKMPVNIDRTQMSGVLLSKPQTELERLATKFVGKMPGFEKAPATNIDVKSKVNILDYLRTPENVLNKIGLGNQMAGLRKAHDAYLAELPKEIAKVTGWSKRPGIGKGSEVSIFRFLDGQPVTLNPQEKEVALEIKAYLKEWADKLKLPEDQRVSSYITHIFEKDLVQKEFDPDLAKILRENVASSVYDPFVQQRLGKQGYVEDVWRALDAYIKRATRKYNMDPALESVSHASDMLEESQYNYIKNYTDRINMRPTEVDNLIDNLIKSSPIGYKLGQRPVTAVTQKARQMVYRGLLGLNPASALKNLSQGANTYAKLGEKYTVVGYAKVVKNLPKFIANMDTELNEVGVLADNFIEDRTLSATKKFWEKTDKGLFYMFNMAEKINRGAAYWGAKAKGLNRGMSEQEAIDFAKKIVRETQFTFGSIDTPLVLSSDLAKTFGQFGSYSLKQGEFLTGMVKNREIAGLVRYIGASLGFIYTIGKAIGMEPKDLIPTVRLGVPPTLQLPVEAVKAGLNVPNEYNQVSEEQNPLLRIAQSKEVQKGLLNYIPAGGQIRKTVEGIGAYNQGASLTPTGRTRFEVEQTPGNLIKAATLGQYTLPGAPEYFVNRSKSQSKRVLEKLNSIPPEEQNSMMMELKEGDPQLFADVKRLKLDEVQKVTSSEKTIRNLPVKNGDRAKAIVRNLKGKSVEEQNKIMQDYIAKGIVTEDVLKQLKNAKAAGVI